MTATSSNPDDRGSHAAAEGPDGPEESPSPGAGRTVLAVVAWTWVSVPFLYAVGSLAVQVPALF